MPEPTEQVPLTTRAILAALRGETDAIMAELADKLSAYAMQHGFGDKPVRLATEECPVHHKVYVHDTKRNIEVCPAQGCGKVRADLTVLISLLKEVVGEVAEVFYEESHRPHEPGGGGAGRVRRKPRPMEPGAIAKRIPLK
jgi:hypothetical protein